MEGLTHGLIDELDHQFDKVLQTAGNASGGGLGDLAEQAQEDQAQTDGPAHGNPEESKAIGLALG